MTQFCGSCGVVWTHGRYSESIFEFSSYCLVRVLVYMHFRHFLTPFLCLFRFCGECGAPQVLEGGNFEEGEIDV